MHTGCPILDAEHELQFYDFVLLIDAWDQIATAAKCEYCLNFAPE